SPGLAERAAALRHRMRPGWAHPHAGFEETRPRSLPLKANPHMHMLEASMAWLEVAPGLGWEALADEIAELCLARFLTPGEGALREYFDGDWRPLAGPKESVVEPGHQFEWAWLLIRWGRWRQRPDAIAAARRLIDIAEASGVDLERGLAINELNADLTPRDSLARLWPQTERIKAFVALSMVAVDSEERTAAWGKAAAAAAGLRRFLDHPVSGAWWEHIGADGVPLVEPTRASSLYHLTCAIAVMALGLQFE
ncbi:MAG: AGE family epimerase/isomerase, partial [Mesorhizobium sp.]|nr:AGE family epimerase/isomerase [Mesorhizobium sp.]